MVTPIILVGMNRSGTKWVSNILCSHDDVIGVQSERARGILETNMFGAMQDKFDLGYPDDYIALVELWAKSEFFKRTNIDKKMFYKLCPRPRSTLEMFDLLMLEFAQSNGKSYWLQKTSPLRAPDVLRYFKNARVVIVRRNLVDTLRSTWGLQVRYRQRRLIRSTFAYVRQWKVLDSIARKYAVVEVEYDRLSSETAKEITRLFTELGLDPARVTAAYQTYQKNTSFASNKQRGAMMSSKEELLVTFLAALFRLIPLHVSNFAATLKSRISGGRRLPLMSGTFGALFDELEDRSRDSE
jgi:hypothetical protein